MLFLLHVGLEQCEVWGVKSAVWSVKESVGSEKCEVWKWEVWSFSLECEERSVKCEVWSFSLECEGSSVKCEVWSVKFEVWSAKSAVWSVECGVWRLCFVSRWKNQTVVEGRTRSGQGVFEL